ncbi:PRC-barrel domain-containing protein [Arthrobacter roseus]|uniref:PRC-barrel domain-containing protein n=1 Tax=Arthrobacter roseus TaxID=136274 RepID=UPI00196450E2|nr:PRC-barrel domain-containing protein [Arthrobacter roseus]MBM7849450.1 sporulation protein YlmC with PRC-barrel domain [Arthrobacter roseus]
MAENTADALVKLSDIDETIALDDVDVRGRHVRDKDGEDLGKVEDLLIDSGEDKVRFLLVASGGFLGLGKEKSFIPVDAITGITEDEVRLDQTRDRVSGAPPYDPELVDQRPYHEDVYGYYGYTPYWGAGYAYPGFPYYPAAY